MTCLAVPGTARAGNARVLHRNSNSPSARYREYGFRCTGEPLANGLAFIEVAVLLILIR